MDQTLTLAAGVAVEFQEPSDFFRILGAPAQDISLIFYKHGAEQSRATNVGAGYAEEFGKGFDKVRISSTVGGDVHFVSRLGNRVRFDTPPTGNVAITNTAGAFAQAAHTVTNASAQLLAANAARRYLLVQNNDAAGDIYLNLDGAAATTAAGVKIAAGGSYELTGYVCTGQINAIGSVASNAAVVVVEG